MFLSIILNAWMNSPKSGFSTAGFTTNNTISQLTVLKKTISCSQPQNALRQLSVVRVCNSEANVHLIKTLFEFVGFNCHGFIVI